MQGQNVLFFQPINLLDQINLEALEVITVTVLMNYPEKTGVFTLMKKNHLVGD